MGFHVAYLLVRGKSRQEIHTSLNLQGTGEFFDFPDGQVIGAQLPNDWYLVYIELFQTGPLFQSMQNQLRSISSNAEAILGMAEECTMSSFACCWQNGRELWEVSHSASSHGTDHFESSGIFPSQFESIRDEHLRRNKEPRGGGCLFEIPAELVLSITGFRYDGNNPGSFPTDQFEVLRLLPPRKPWWQFWK